MVCRSWCSLSGIAGYVTSPVGQVSDGLHNGREAPSEGIPERHRSGEAERASLLARHEHRKRRILGLGRGFVGHDAVRNDVLLA